MPLLAIECATYWSTSLAEKAWLREAIRVPRLRHVMLSLGQVQQATLMACILVNGYIVWQIGPLQVNTRKLPVLKRYGMLIKRWTPAWQRLYIESDCAIKTVRDIKMLLLNT